MSLSTAVSAAVVLATALAAHPIAEVVARVQDVSEDYYEADEDRTAAVFARLETLCLRLTQMARADPRLQPLLPSFEALARAVSQRAPPREVDGLAETLTSALIDRGHVQTVPPDTVALDRGALLFPHLCSACHGQDGKGQGPVGKGLTPPPTDLTDDGSINPLSPFRVFEAVTYGMDGTAMPGFQGVPESDRWALAFYVFTFRLGPCTGEGRPVSLAERSRTRDSNLVARYGEAALPCLRRRLPEHLPGHEPRGGDRR